MVVVMNQPSYDKFKDSVKMGGKIFIDNSLVSDYAETLEGVETFAIPATELARENGLNGLANMIMLGKILKETALFTAEEIEDLRLCRRVRNLLAHNKIVPYADVRKLLST